MNAYCLYFRHQLCALVLLAVAIWILIDPQATNIAHVSADGSNSELLNIAAYLLIAFGALLFLISLLGIIGAVIEHRFILSVVRTGPLLSSTTDFILHYSLRNVSDVHRSTDDKNTCIFSSFRELIRWLGVRRLSVCKLFCANRFYYDKNGLIATKLAHDGLQVSAHPECAQGQGQGQRSRDTGTFVLGRKSLLLAGK